MAERIGKVRRSSGRAGQPQRVTVSGKYKNLAMNRLRKAAGQLSKEQGDVPSSVGEPTASAPVTSGADTSDRAAGKFAAAGGGANPFQMALPRHAAPQDAPQETAHPLSQPAPPAAGGGAAAGRCSLHVKGIPPEFNTLDYLSPLFQPFGATNIRPNPAKYCATVSYSSNAQAMQAKKAVREVAPGHRVQIFWNQFEAVPTVAPAGSGGGSGPAPVFGQAAPAAAYHMPGQQQQQQQQQAAPPTFADIVGGGGSSSRPSNMMRQPAFGGGLQATGRPGGGGGGGVVVPSSLFQSQAQSHPASTSSAQGNVSSQASLFQSQAQSHPASTSRAQGNVSFQASQFQSQAQSHPASTSSAQGNVSSQASQFQSQHTTSRPQPGSLSAAPQQSMFASQPQLASSAQGTNRQPEQWPKQSASGSGHNPFATTHLGTGSTMTHQPITATTQMQAVFGAQPSSSSSSSRSQVPNPFTISTPTGSTASSSSVFGGTTHSSSSGSSLFPSTAASRNAMAMSSTSRTSAATAAAAVPLPSPAIIARSRVARASIMAQSPIISNRLPDIPHPHIPLPKAVTSDSAEDRFKALDERDKAMRQGMTKQSDLTTATALVGTCPDMCPEKERYRRQYQRLLSSLEMKSDMSGDVDPNKSVSEYSRSSADKDEPLPHEVRPAPVLQRTMEYLCTGVMETGDGRWAEWYDFLWNRTRAIRKDITVQHLVSVEIVELVEQCARFHVFCAHHLCEQEMMAFDPKINNENMSKCIQTLKHMYSDLRDKNIHCPNEAEFMAYDILLGLNDGDTLRQVLRYPQHVRDSPEVRSAVDMFSVLNEGNYIRFFRLVKATTLLNASLLHRYFPQMRSRALCCMCAVVSPKGSKFPLADMQRYLCCDTTAQVITCCQRHGLATSNTHVTLQKTAFRLPEEKYIAPMSHTVASKLTTRIGEVVFGGPIPSRPPHSPMDSFSDGGRKKLSTVGAVDGSADPALARQQQQLQQQQQQQQAARQQQLMEQRRQQERQELLDKQRHLEEELRRQKEAAQRAEEDRQRKIAADKAREEAERQRKLAEEEHQRRLIEEKINQEKQRALRKLRQEEEERKQRAAEAAIAKMVAEDLLSAGVSAHCKHIAQTTIKQARDQRNAEKSRVLASSLMEQCIADQVGQVTAECMSDAWRERRERQAAMKRQEERCVSAIVAELIGNAVVSLNQEVCTEVLESPESAAALEAYHASQSLHKQQHLWSPIDLSSTIMPVDRSYAAVVKTRSAMASSLASMGRGSSNWELTVSLPADSVRMGGGSTVAQWIQDKLCREPTHRHISPTAELWQSTSRTGAGGRQVVCICKAVRGPVSAVRQPLSPLDSLLFVKSSQHNPIPDSTRLDELLSVACSAGCKPSVLIICDCPSSFHHRCAGLRDTLRSYKISSCRFQSVVHHAVPLHQQLCQNLVWMFDRHCQQPQPPPPTAHVTASPAHTSPGTFSTPYVRQRRRNESPSAVSAKRVKSSQIVSPTAHRAKILQKRLHAEALNSAKFEQDLSMYIEADVLNLDFLQSSSLME